jgi:acyl-CoA thioesterase
VKVNNEVWAESIDDCCPLRRSLPEKQAAGSLRWLEHWLHCSVKFAEPSSPNEPVIFDRDLALTGESLSSPQDGPQVRRFSGTFSDRWFIDRALHGGHVIAAMVRAVEAAVADPARSIRSLTNHYLLPAKAGAFHVDVTIERSGRTLTNVSARLIQQGQTVALALSAHGGPWESYDWDHTAMPKVPDPEDCPDLWEGTGGFTNLHKNWQYGLAMGPPMGSGKITDTERTESVSGGWVRLAEPRPVDSAVAAALTDTWVPMPFAYIDESHPVMFPTIELTVHFLDPLPLAGDTGIDPCFVWHRIDTSRSGFVVQDTEVWTRSGRLIARGRQNALLIPVTR